MKKVKVLLADSKDLFREGLAELLQNQPHIEVICQCHNGLKALEKAKETEPDIVLMDTYMPDGDSIEVVKHIGESLPNTKVAMLTDCREEEKLFSALSSGARGYLLKNIEVDTLVECVDLIAKGELVISPPLGGKLLNEFGAMRKEKEAGELTGKTVLSEREIEILKLVVKGATNKEIAERLILTENTVKVHMKNILGKLQLRNKQQAVAYAIQHGFVTEIEENEEKTG